MTLALTLALLLSLACSGGAESTAPVSMDPTAIGPQDCDSCGMTVAEQPSPRGQVVYRDGTHAYFCSIGDMLVALQAPSPHGKAQGIYVESLGAGFDPGVNSTAELPWIPAESASYVVGVERPMVMGAAVLSYESGELAAAAAGKFGGKVQGWAGLSE